MTQLHSFSAIFHIDQWSLKYILTHYVSLAYCAFISGYTVHGYIFRDSVLITFKCCTEVLALRVRRDNLKKICHNFSLCFMTVFCSLSSQTRSWWNYVISLLQFCCLSSFVQIQSTNIISLKKRANDECARKPNTYHISYQHPGSSRIYPH